MGVALAEQFPEARTAAFEQASEVLKWDLLASLHKRVPKTACVKRTLLNPLSTSQAMRLTPFYDRWE